MKKLKRLKWQPKKDVGLIGIRMFEFGAMGVDTFALPTKKARAAQERFVRRLYRNANELAEIIAEPKKVYKRINSKGQMEVV